jgi:hypothetical protein
VGDAGAVQNLSFNAGPLRLDVHYKHGTEGFRAQLEHWSTEFATDLHGTRLHVRCEIEQYPELLVPTVCSDLARSPRVLWRSGAREAYLEWQYYRAIHEPGHWQAVISTRSPALEHALRGAVAHELMFEHGLLFHGATLRWNGTTLLLAGHPGAGKSTISVEGAPDQVLSNEISILAPDTDGQWWAWPSPFWGSGDQPRYSPPQPLTAVATLRHGQDRNQWAPLRGVHAMAALAPHVGCQTEEQAGSRLLLNALRNLVESLPIYSFAWYRPAHPLNDSPWKPFSP